MTDFNKVLGTIASALQLDANELTTALKDGDEWLADDEITTKLGGIISTRVKAAKEDQRKRALRETSDSVAKWMKGQGFEPEDKELRGTALLDAFSEHLREKIPSGVDGERAKTLSRDDLAKLPEVQHLLKEAGQAAMQKHRAELETVKTEFSQYKGRIEAELTEQVALSTIAQALDQGGVMLEPTGSKVSKEARIKAVAQLLDLRRVKRDDKGNPYFVDDSGEPLKDDYGDLIQFSKRAVEIGKDLYGERGPDPAKGGGDPRQGSGNGESGKRQQVYHFDDQKSFDTALFREPDPAKRAQMSEDFFHQTQKQQQKAAGS